MQKELLFPTLKQDYQVMRSTDSHHTIKDGLSMTIKTSARIYPNGIKDDFIHVTFHVKDGKEHITISSGAAHELLIEKYFKPEMIQW